MEGEISGKQLEKFEGERRRGGEDEKSGSQHIQSEILLFRVLIMYE